MVLHHLRIEGFRGIKSLDWHPNGRFLCLIGPNDSTKTTILEAIELVSLARYNAGLSEADFHNREVSNGLSIEATFGDLPPALLDEVNKFGLFLRGYDADRKRIVSAPEDGLKQVLTVRFETDQSLEPVWSVVKDGEARRIPWQDRETLGVNHLGREIDRHLTWARGSALTRLTNSQSGTPTAQVVATVSREANHVFKQAPKKELNDAVDIARTQAAQLGAAFKDLKPGLDVSGLSFGASAFGLQDGDVPARLWGLGTRRITALAIQQKGADADSVLLVDEIEAGLEPFRVRHLVDCFLRPEGKAKNRGQMIFTTHSPSTVIPLPVECLRFVRNNNGVVSVSEVAVEHRPEMQVCARAYSHALFARKVLVCEGATEEGMCRGLLDFWAAEHGGVHPTHLGFVAVNGGGNTKAPVLAMELKRIGYDVAVLGDSDKPWNPNEAELAHVGISVFLWGGGVATEERISADLPLDALQQLVLAAIETLDEGRVRNQVGEIGKVAVDGSSVADWVRANDEARVRTAIGKSAKEGKVDGGTGWFKNITMGVKLGRILAAAISTIPTSPLASKLREVTGWVYA